MSFWAFEATFNVVKALIALWSPKGGAGLDGWSEYTLVIGHSASGNLRKSGPLCHILSMWMCPGCLPLVSQSAPLCSPSVQYQSFGSVPSWISPTCTAVNVLNPL